MEEHELSLKALIRAVSDELIASRAERLAAGRVALFEVSDVTIEVSFVVTESTAGGGGFDLKVIKADASRSYDQQAIHKVTVKLKSLTDDDTVLTELGEELPLRPRPQSLRTERD